MITLRHQSVTGRWPGRFLMTLFICSTLVLATALPSSAGHIGSSNSVDGGEIRFENETAFDDSLDWAVSQWNAVGSVDYKKDTAFTNADLQVRDVNKTDVTWCGAYSKASGADNVFLNKKYYDTFTTNERRRCTTHELGHGLGIDDHQSASWKTKSIMFMCANCTTFLAPQAHDKSDYHSIWG